MGRLISPKSTKDLAFTLHSFRLRLDLAVYTAGPSCIHGFRVYTAGPSCIYGFRVYTAGPSCELSYESSSARKYVALN